MMRACIAALLFMGCIAAQEKDFYTSGLANGRLWKGLNPAAKVSYVLGYREGILRLVIEIPDDALAHATGERLHGFNINNGEIMGALDRFYDDPLNARIAIIDAIVIVLNRARGVSSTDIEHQIEQLRRNLSATTGKPQ
jgi:hypothetical protein